MLSGTAKGRYHRGEVLEMRIWKVNAVILVGLIVLSGWMIGSQLQATVEGTANQAGEDTFSHPDRVVGELYDLSHSRLARHQTGGRLRRCLSKKR